VRATAKMSMSALVAIVAMFCVVTASASAATGGATAPSQTATKKAAKKKTKKAAKKKASEETTTDSAAGAPVSGGASATTPADDQPTVTGSLAKIQKDGLAAAPSLAPLEVKQAIWAANDIIGKPYVYGGGHASFKSKGYDCSGTVSYALHGGDLLDSPLDSGSFMSWGKGGRGDWITIFTNEGHAYVVIAGIRLDTSAADDPKGGEGPRWRPLRKSNSGFTVRHPSGF
jgi:cell wall-associated NlpC family hydrolase